MIKNNSWNCLIVFKSFYNGSKLFEFYDRRCICCVDILAGRIKMEIRCKQDTAEITRLNAQFSQEKGNKIPMSLTFSSFSSYFSLLLYFPLLFPPCVCVIFLILVAVYSFSNCCLEFFSFSSFFLYLYLSQLIEIILNSFRT